MRPSTSPTAASTARAHREPGFIAKKRARLEEPHVAPIQELVREIRSATGDPAVPYADPDGGGVRARVLFVLEAPAGAAAHGSGMLSPDNDDQTAANIWGLYRESGLQRSRCTHWNAVPWYLGDGSRVRAAKRSDIEAGAAWLDRLIDLLPELRLVVAMGVAARRSMASYLLRDGARLVPWLAVPHPSQRVMNIDPSARAGLQRAFARAAMVSKARRRGEGAGPEV